MNISENEAHSAIYCSENEYFARRCRHYKAKESKAEWLPSRISWLGKRYGDREIHENGLENDPEIGIEWPKVEGTYKGTASAEGYSVDGVALNLSDKDQKWLGLKDTFKF